MYSLSTCWNSHRHTDGRALLREVRELGFEHAELSHGTRISLLPGILDAVDAGEIKISSLHNFCPLPMGVNYPAPNLYEFSAEKPRERELAVRHTQKTLDFAVRVKSPMVVLHLGSIDMKDFTSKLVGMTERGDNDTPKYRKLCLEVDRKREARKQKFVEHAHETLRRILPEAESRGLKLGIEIRESLEELPLDSDWQLFFKDFSSPAIGYWHDTGHAQIKANLGFMDHALHLASLSDRLLGFHIHDVQFPGRDHCAPGSGMINFAALKPLVKPGHIKVFELGPSLTAEEVKAGVAYVKGIWGPE